MFFCFRLQIVLDDIVLLTFCCYLRLKVVVISDQGVDVFRFRLQIFYDGMLLLTVRFVVDILDQNLLFFSDYKVLIYNGQLDIIIANTLTTNMVHNLDWKGKEGFKKVQYSAVSGV